MRKVSEMNQVQRQKLMHKIWEKLPEGERSDQVTRDKFRGIVVGKEKAGPYLAEQMMIAFIEVQGRAGVTLEELEDFVVTFDLHGYDSLRTVMVGFFQKGWMVLIKELGTYVHTSFLVDHSVHAKA